MKIRVGIFGYGNLGRGVECALAQNNDMMLAAIFTRRNPASLKTVSKNVPVYSASEVEKYKDDIDVMIICGGSATDLPVQTPALAKHFTVVDSFDTHAKILAHFANVDKEARLGGNIAVISVGWDPGMFSLNRLIGESILPCGNAYTFWGKGVSQGHSDAIRRLDGVLDAKQYTIPVENALEAVRQGENPSLTPRQKHKRECFVVAREDADKEKIEKEICTMPNYFADYDTTVNFISEEEFRLNHSGISHGGFVIRSGKTGENKENNHIIEYSIRLDSNPEFTASVIVAYARAAVRMKREGMLGCKTVFDVPPSYLSPNSYEQIISELL